MLYRDPIPGSVNRALASLGPELQADRFRQLCSDLGINVDLIDGPASSQPEQPTLAPWTKPLPEMVGMIRRLIGQYGPSGPDSDTLDDVISSATNDHISVRPDNPSWGMVNAVVLAEMAGVWSPDVIIKLISGLNDFHRDIMIGADGRDVEKGLQNVMSWCVLGILAAPQFVANGVSEKTTQLLHALVQDEVEHFVACYSGSFTQGLFKRSEIIGEFEKVLYGLAGRYPQTSPFVQSAIGILKDDSERELPILVEKLDQIFRSEEAPGLTHAPDGVLVAFEAQSRRLELAAGLEMLGYFQNLKDAEAWSSPFQVAAEKLTHGLTTLRIGAPGPQRLRFITSLLDHTGDNLHFYYPTSQLEIFSNDTQDVTEVVNALMGYVRGDGTTKEQIRCFAAISTEKKPAIDRLLEELSALKAQVGGERITIMTDADLQNGVTDGRITSGAILGGYINGVPRDILVFLTPREPDAERLEKFYTHIDRGVPPFVIYSLVVSLARDYVVPLFLQIRGGEGQPQFVAWDPREVVRIAREQHLIPDLGSDLESLAQYTSVLYIHRAGPDDEPEDAIPADEVPDEVPDKLGVG